MRNQWIVWVAVLFFAVCNASPGMAQGVHLKEKCDGSSHDCCTTASCCSADAGDCGQDISCACSHSCGGGIGACSCICGGSSIRSTFPHEGTPTFAAPKDKLNVRITRLGGVPFDEVISFVRSQTNWTYSLPADASTVYLTGDFNGTVDEVHRELARSAGFKLNIDVVNTSAVFLEASR